ncbi:MAG: Hsp20/alpha crystallin family protein [Candidatus Pacebacteria bacterium]|nr:Hsp20/alpha crystallin family protein [Candidatus Paceibacterota bacterium]
MKFKIRKEKKQIAPKNNEWLSDERIGEPSIDAYETNNEVVIVSPIGGINAKDIEISFADDMLIIKGKRENMEIKEGDNYFCQECFWGSFVKKVIIPKEVEVSKAKAIVKNGILTLTIPKKKSEERKEIKISVKEDY